MNEYPVYEEGGGTIANDEELTVLRGAGRPKTRQDEAAMFLIWRLVMTEVYVHGAKGVNDACRRLMRRRIVIDTKEESRKITKISTVGTLRQRFYAADAALNDPQTYPILFQRCAALAADLPMQGMRQRFTTALYGKLKQMGFDPAAVTGVGAVPASIQELHTLEVLGEFKPQ